MLEQVDWSAWNSHLKGLGFSVYQHFYLDLYPSLKASRHREQVTIEVGLTSGGTSPWSTWHVTATMAAKEVLPEVSGFKFVFDQGWNGRAIYGGGAWFIRELPQGPVSLLPPIEKLGQLIAEQEKKAQALVALLRGLGAGEE